MGFIPRSSTTRENSQSYGARPSNARTTPARTAAPIAPDTDTESSELTAWSRGIARDARAAWDSARSRSPVTARVLPDLSSINDPMTEVSKTMPRVLRTTSGHKAATRIAAVLKNQDEGKPTDLTERPDGATVDSNNVEDPVAERTPADKDKLRKVRQDVTRIFEGALFNAAKSAGVDPHSGVNRFIEGAVPMIVQAVLSPDEASEYLRTIAAGFANTADRLDMLRTMKAAGADDHGTITVAVPPSPVSSEDQEEGDDFLKALLGAMSRH